MTMKTNPRCTVKTSGKKIGGGERHDRSENIGSGSGSGWEQGKYPPAMVRLGVGDGPCSMREPLGTDLAGSV